MTVPCCPLPVSLIVPALNEGACIGPLLAELQPGLVHEVIVVDNGSTDDTAAVAARCGARVVYESRRGYGYACAAGAAAATGAVLVFMDGDGSFVPGELVLLVSALGADDAVLVLGTRMSFHLVRQAMPIHQRIGNQLVASLLRFLYGIHVTDLGPFRAIHRDFLADLDMQEQTYGWPVEMMVKAARQHARLVEVPVSYRPRLAGRSKVGGTVRGTLLATYRILRVTLRYAF